jgi:hypothetical protein
MLKNAHNLWDIFSTITFYYSNTVLKTGKYLKGRQFSNLSAAAAVVFPSTNNAGLLLYIRLISSLGVDLGILQHGVDFR